MCLTECDRAALIIGGRGPPGVVAPWKENVCVFIRNSSNSYFTSTQMHKMLVVDAVQFYHRV